VTGVDYGSAQVARAYAAGRALSDPVLAAWGQAVQGLLPRRAGLVVADLGAGTGIFAEAWPAWAPGCRVIAVEPSAAMRQRMPEAVRARAVGGRAEALPLRAGTVDVAWLSTVIHHTDLAACGREVDRVVAGDGVVLVRGLFADLGRPSAVDLLPGWERAVSAFPSTAAVAEAFRPWTGLARFEVQDAGPATAGEAAARIRNLRQADTLLGQFTDEELDRGLTALDRRDPAERLPASTLGLLALRRR
jgi:ubiquinone/menaquinone biosynthesis C-methylase UbiE